MNALPAKKPREITAAEVSAWFGDSEKSKLGMAEYGKIAVSLTSYR
jgi:hypothetical protein